MLNPCQCACQAQELVILPRMLSTRHFELLGTGHPGTCAGHKFVKPTLQSGPLRIEQWQDTGWLPSLKWKPATAMYSRSYPKNVQQLSLRFGRGCIQASSSLTEAETFRGTLKSNYSVVPIYFSIHPSIHPSIHLSIHPSIYLSIHPPTHLHWRSTASWMTPGRWSGSTDKSTNSLLVFEHEVECTWNCAFYWARHNEMYPFAIHAWIGHSWLLGFEKFKTRHSIHLIGTPAKVVSLHPR